MSAPRLGDEVACREVSVCWIVQLVRKGLKHTSLEVGARLQVHFAVSAFE